MTLRRPIFFALVLTALLAAPARARQAVTFPSLADNGKAEAPTVLTGYLFRPKGAGPHPALVFLHGCAGIFHRDRIRKRDAAWAALMTGRGYVVLMVDSLGPRHHGEMCSRSGFDRKLYLKRPRDAYGALAYLQAQNFVRPDRIGLIGWSQGGGVTLFALREASLGRPENLPPDRDFRAAVAFYPGSCNDRFHTKPWTSKIPLMVLVGARDVWTPAPPCEELIHGAKSRGSPAEIVVYPGAYHDFDAPDLRQHTLPKFVTRMGVVPIVGTDPAARADALARTTRFLDSFLKEK